MPKPPLVSVLIPCYNREKYIRQCIDSVLTQDFQDFEIICSDNASTDGTWQILQAYAAADARIRIFRNETNLGPMKNWERCLDNASGEYVHWLWSDDWVEHGFYTKQLAVMRDTGRRCSMTAAKLVLESGYAPIIGSSPVRSLEAKEFITTFIASPRPPFLVSPAAYLLPRTAVLHWFIRRAEDLPDRKCYDKAIGPDLVMILGAIFDSGGVVCVAEPMVNFRSHAESITVANNTAGCYATSMFYFLKRNPDDFNCGVRELVIVLYRALGSSAVFHSLLCLISVIGVKTVCGCFKPKM